MTVGEKIKIARESKGMSQEELALKMGYKDRSSISKIEKNSDDKIGLDIVQKAADVLGCSPLYLMGWETIPPDNSDNEVDDRELKFAHLYSQLKDSEKDVVDKLLESLVNSK